jgi:hypothetical protein
MFDSFATSFARCPAVVLCKNEGENMVSNWEDYIVATRTKRGEFSVYGRKWAEDYSQGRYKKKWFTIFSKKGIKIPAELLKAINVCQMEMSLDVYWSEVIVELAKLDAEFAKNVKVMFFEEE